MPLQQWIPQMAEGCILTIKLFFITALFSVPLGLVLTFLYTTKNKLINKIISFYILIMRGTPLLLQIFFIYFGLPYVPVIGEYLTINDRFTAGAVAFILNYAAYFAEIFRGGIESIPKGQYEAAQILGYTKMETFFIIILPQVFKIVLPSITNEVITLVKDTSLSFVLAIPELFTVAKQVAASEASILALFIAGIFYYILNAIVAFIMELLEKKLNYYQ